MSAPSELLCALFGDAEVAAQLGDRARVAGLLEFEVALAQAEAELGVVPRSCVAAIRAAAQPDAFDLAALAREAPRAGNWAIPLVRELTAQVAERDAQAARWVHWGATSQDALDTGLVLQLGRALPPLLRQLERAEAQCAEHAERYVAVAMPGRTWLQQATPTSFGLKAAGWLDALARCREQLEQAHGRAQVLQFGGASGTLAALGERGLEVAQALGARLGLQVPDVPWHAQRDRLVQLGCALGVVVGALGKIARDLALLAQTEVGEAYPGAGAGGSSSMPHKRNPVAAAAVLAAAARAPALVATLLGAMPQEHERGLGGWQAEWVALPELVLTAAGAARSLADALADLAVDPQRMRENLERSGGLIFSEAVAQALAASLGKSAAHALVEAACARARAQGRAFAHVLREDPAVAERLAAHELERLLSPEGSLGMAGAFAARVLARWRGAAAAPRG